MTGVVAVDVTGPAEVSVCSEAASGPGVRTSSSQLRTSISRLPM